MEDKVNILVNETNQTESFVTAKMAVQVYALNATFKGEAIYSVVSTPLKGGEANIRFCNAQQLKNILETYRYSKKGFSL